MKKRDRQHMIKQLISKEAIRNQAEFVKMLDEVGVKVTQATVSRDIKEMRLVKVPSRLGGYKYSLPQEKRINIEKKLQQAVDDSLISIAVQDKNVLIKVSPGSGAVLSSLVEKMNYDSVFGVLCDDNTVLIICVSDAAAIEFRDKINQLVVK
ncbi:ArgR family transcriptional regulator [Nicoliella spurrieriana]|uniref:Arginine repressor n=1 Tax=Nicoliella spurrieriana TaxID=2925830 RepID=A0A976RRU5_9LACO|nr:ArgR family transcriptional regulator [Nicoliella spurrieriana]UQS86648.1 ArgR family transcriptional regulator [Nicoliella spurrieriana]